MKILNSQIDGVDRISPRSKFIESKLINTKIMPNN